MFRNYTTLHLNGLVWACLVSYSACVGFLGLITGGIGSSATLLLAHPIALCYFLKKQRFARISALVGVATIVLIGLFEIANLRPPEIEVLRPLGLWLAIALAIGLSLIFFSQNNSLEAVEQASEPAPQAVLSGPARRFFDVLRETGDAVFITITALGRVDQVFGARSLIGDVQEGRLADHALVDAQGDPLRSGVSRLANGAQVCVLRHQDSVRGNETLLILRDNKREAEESPDAFREKLQARTQFFAEFGHDLRSPLNAVIGFADIMANEVRGPIPEVYREYPGLIRESGETLLSLIEDMLAYARSEAGTYRLLPEPTNLHSVAEDVMRGLEPAAERADIRLTWSGEDDVWALADPMALRRIWDNLASNALKYSESKSNVTLSAHRQAQFAELRVEDTGVGMEASELDRITAPFEQGANAKGKAGLGLGLALVHRLTELQGGTTQITSRLGHGTTVIVRLPVADAPSANEAAE